MGRPRNIANLYDPPKSNTQFIEGHKSKGILDDYAERQNVSSKEGTIEHIPTEDNHIANKKYVDDNIGVGTWTDTSTNTGTNKTFDSFTNLVEADQVHIQVRNESGSAMTRGQLVYVSGYNLGLDRYLVSLADADGAGTHPVIGILDVDINNNQDGHLTHSGKIVDLNTSAFSVGDSVYMTTTAGVFGVKPAGVSSKVQAIGTVLRSNINNGVLAVVGAGRTNDIPNDVDHTSILNIGTNSHIQLDTHLALVNAHIDWTNATANFKTTGIIDSSNIFIREDNPFVTFDSSVVGPNWTIQILAADDTFTIQKGESVLVINDSGNFDFQDGNILTTGTITSRHITSTSEGSPVISVIDTTNNATTVLQSLNSLGLVGTTSNHEFRILSNNITRVNIQAGGNVIFNEGGVDADFRVEGLNAPSLFVVNAGLDRVILTGKAGTGLIILDINANDGTAVLDVRDDGIIINDGGNDKNFRVESNNNANMLFVDAGTDRVGIGVSAPASKLHVDQSNASGGIPTLNLDQADISEGFINFIGSDRGAVETSPVTGFKQSAASIRVEVNGTKYLIPLFPDA